MGRKVKIGLIQVKHNEQEDLNTKWDNLIQLGEECLSNGAELIYFPEAYQYTHDRAILNRHEELCEVTTSWKGRCAVLAKKYHAYVAPWDYEVDKQGNIYNSSYILDRDGMEVGRFRKVHLTYSEQIWGIKNGIDFPVFDLDFGRVGFMICFDNYWPESARILGLRGAELILYPLFGDTLMPQWELKLRVRAIDNSLYIASSQISNSYDIAYTGLINPEGTIVCKIDDAPSWRVVEADLGRPVITSTGGDKEYSENILRYLERCRNVIAYHPLIEPLKETWSWENIFFGKRP